MMTMMKPGMKRMITGMTIEIRILKAAEKGNRFAQERLLHLNSDGTENLDSYASGYNSSDDIDEETAVCNKDISNELLPDEESLKRRERGRKVLMEEFGEEFGEIHLVYENDDNSST